MFGISGEHLFILGVVLLLFGPKKLPELGNTLGKAMRNFKDAIAGVEEAKFRHLKEERDKAAGYDTDYPNHAPEALAAAEKVRAAEEAAQAAELAKSSAEHAAAEAKDPKKPS